MKRFVVDGNFTAQHMNMRQPQSDVFLSDGLGYMVKEAEYQAHLSSAKESKEVRVIVARLFCSGSETGERGLVAAITERSMEQMPLEATFKPQVWVPLLVLAMGVLYLTQ